VICKASPAFLRKSHVSFPSLWERKEKKKEKEIVERRTKGKKESKNGIKRKEKRTKAKKVSSKLLFPAFPYGTPRRKRASMGGRLVETIFACFTENHS